MKQFKRCDGYVLPYVLVVFLILSAVSVSICGTALNNLRAQEAAVERSKALYEAEGEIEKLLAKVENVSLNNAYTSKSNVRDAFMSAAETAIGIDECTQADTDVEFTLALQIDNSKVTVDTIARVSLRIDSHTETVKDSSGNVISSTDYYEIAGTPNVTYDSYNISYEGGGVE